MLYIFYNFTAHTTQFTEVGWKYLAHGSGAGHLDKGGSYVSIVSPDSKELTIVIETMVCIRCPAFMCNSLKLQCL